MGLIRLFPATAEEFQGYDSPQRKTSKTDPLHTLLLGLDVPQRKMRGSSINLGCLDTLKQTEEHRQETAMEEVSFFDVLKVVLVQPFHYLVFFLTAAVIVLGLYQFGLIRPLDWNSTANCILFILIYFGIVGVSWGAGCLATYSVRKKWGRRGMILTNVMTVVGAAVFFWFFPRSPGPNAFV